MSKNKYIQWMPLVATISISVISLIIYTLANADRSIIMYVQVMAAALVPAILPTISIVTKKEFPLTINVLIAIHIILASSLGSAMGFYSLFGCWDLIMHGYFGFIAAVTLYILIQKWSGDQLSHFGFMVLIFLGTMGGAAIWEMFEFTCDTLLGCDAQRVQESLSLGVSPVKDTMTDIIMAAVGIMVFYMGQHVRKHFKKVSLKARSR